MSREGEGPATALVDMIEERQDLAKPSDALEMHVQNIAKASERLAGLGMLPNFALYESKSQR